MKTVMTTLKPKRGWAAWIESGTWFTARKVDPKKFGKHAYDNGGYEQGIRECPCGCFMGSYSSSGPVDPWGPCPKNPKTTIADIRAVAKEAKI